GNRAMPHSRSEVFSSGQRMGALDAPQAGEIAKQFADWHNGLVQRIDGVPANYSTSFAGGTSWMVGDGDLGLVATAGYRNGWRTRDNVEQTSASLDLSSLDKDYRQVATEDRIVANELLGIGGRKSGVAGGV